MNFTKHIFLMMFIILSAPASADNFDYCYSNQKGLDEECYARKEANTKIYQEIINNRPYNARPTDYYGAYSPYRYDANGRFVPIPIPQRFPSILPGMD